MAKNRRFIRYFGGAFINGIGVALYEGTEDGSYLARVVNVASGKPLGVMQLTQDELDAVPGNDAGRIANVIEMVTHGRVQL